MCVQIDNAKRQNEHVNSNENDNVHMRNDNNNIKNNNDIVLQTNDWSRI